MSRKRIAYSISSWFCVPEEKMVDFEILNRASAFLVNSKCKDFASKNKYHIVTCSHVVAPWRWPKYYPQDWLKAVNDSHTLYTVEVRDERNGIFTTQHELGCEVYHHPTKDLAVLHFADEKDVLLIVDNLGIVQNMPLMPKEFIFPLIGDNVQCHGHNVILPSNAPLDSKGDCRVCLPQTIEGSMQLRTEHQNFLKTDTVLTDGMCGGPVSVTYAAKEVAKLKSMIQANDDDEFPVSRDHRFHFIAGMIDGIVPNNYEIPKMRGLASFVSHSDISRFLELIEAGEAEATITGDIAVHHVGSDQDEKKMNLEEIMRDIST